jgi:hypothetical protein
MKLFLFFLTSMALLATARPSESLHKQAGSHTPGHAKREVNEWYPVDTSEEERKEIEEKLNNVFIRLAEINTGRTQTLPTN